MTARSSPATVVVCAPVARGRDAALRHGAGTVTWVMELESLLRDDRPGGDGGLALAIDPEWLASRQALRAALVQARHVAPGLEAAVFRGGPLRHHAILAEEGIRVVVVDSFADVGRGSRRPAPAGWPCRNVAWGLWEVRACPPRRSRAWAWLPGLPAARRGALHVATATGSGAGGMRLERLVDWADRGVARGRAATVALADLPSILEGGRTAPVSASVLRAA